MQPSCCAIVKEQFNDKLTSPIPNPCCCASCGLSLTGESTGTIGVAWPHQACSSGGRLFCSLSCLPVRITTPMCGSSLASVKHQDISMTTSITKGTNSGRQILRICCSSHCVMRVWLQVPPVVADWMLTCPGCKCIACLWPVDGDLQPKPSYRLEQLLLPPCNSCCHG
jgi:hypothetical protein